MVSPHAKSKSSASSGAAVVLELADNAEEAVEVSLVDFNFLLLQATKGDDLLAAEEALLKGSSSSASSSLRLALFLMVVLSPVLVATTAAITGVDLRFEAVAALPAEGGG